MHAQKIAEIVTAWAALLAGVNDWQILVKNNIPKKTGCGLVYEITNPIDRPDESFAIADMRGLQFSEPHHHPETEIYFVLQGSGLIAVGGKETLIQKGSVIVIPSNVAHFTIPEKDLVLAVVNTPPFKNENYHVLHEENAAVQFDKAQFKRLVDSKSII